MSADLPGIPAIDAVATELRRIVNAYQRAVIALDSDLRQTKSDLEQERRENARLREQLQKATA